jgi:hypothetical protein
MLVAGGWYGSVVGWQWVIGLSKPTNVAYLAVFDLGTDSALSRQPKCVKKKRSHMALYDPPRLTCGGWWLRPACARTLHAG